MNGERGGTGAVRTRSGRTAPVRRRPTGDDGSAVVEFLGASLLLLVPVVYLVVTLGAVQAATFAVEGAAREAARAAVTSEPHGELVAAAVRLALQDQGVDAVPEVVVSCSADCRTAGTTVTVTVDLRVSLPGVPAVLQGAVPAAVPVGASVTAPVDAFSGRAVQP